MAATSATDELERFRKRRRLDIVDVGYAAKRPDVSDIINRGYYDHNTGQQTVPDEATAAS
ncbi:hypothetical protein BDV95DRAFT_566630 [Massariosphaeria phaeospora]|uniref:Uncharacterized protein n=1 Tax=Massariosphaeria phaeospora TaxID=100035 RepID=A0A7C8IDW2_9PLEO|nr:hypothetical protein BDV95DRAFT_566630 [Massariosphaeria phaeospora]